MSNKIYIKLEEFRQKGAAWQCQQKAESLLLELKSLLPSEDYIPLSISHFHYRSGEGAAEFYDVVNKLISKYRSDIPPINFKKTFL